MYESSLYDGYIDYAYNSQQGLIDTYLPPSECCLENFLTSIEPSSSRELNSTSSSPELNSSCGSPIVQWRSQVEQTTPVCTNFFNPARLNLNSSIDYQQSDYNFNMAPTTGSYPIANNSFGSYSETFESCTENSWDDKSYQSSEPQTSFESSRPAKETNKKKKSNVKIEKVTKKLTKSLAREQKIANKKFQDTLRSRGVLSNPFANPNRPVESVPQLILKALLSSNNYTMQLNEIYNFITKNYEYYANQDEYATGVWKASVRYNLTRQDYFIKSGNKNAKGNYWTIDPLYLRGILTQNQHQATY